MVMYKVKIEFEDKDVQWYILSAKNRIGALDYIYDHFEGIEDIEMFKISREPIFCIPQEVYDDLDNYKLEW